MTHDDSRRIRACTESVTRPCEILRASSTISAVGAGLASLTRNSRSPHQGPLSERGLVAPAFEGDTCFEYQHQLSALRLELGETKEPSSSGRLGPSAWIPSWQRSTACPQPKMLSATTTSATVLEPFCLLKHSYTCALACAKPRGRAAPSAPHRPAVPGSPASSNGMRSDLCNSLIEGWGILQTNF